MLNYSNNESNRRAYFNHISTLPGKVKTLYAFGSVLTDKFNQESDVDLIVDFEPLDILQYADNYFDLKFALQDILNRRIDLLEEKAIRNPFFKRSVDQQKRLIYGS